MKKSLLTLLLLPICAMIYSQVLVKQWDHGYGWNNNEMLVEIKLDNGGFLLAGSSGSNSGGDKTQDNWDTTTVSWDYWLIKVDTSGNKIWDRRYGGVSDDILGGVCKADDGFLLGGVSYSNASGNKTQNRLGTSDGWLVKIDLEGTLQWEKRFGGNMADRITSIVKAHDGGYLLGCVSYSNASGEKSQDNWDQSLLTPDYWIVKIDSAGNKQWDKRYGGTNQDLFTSVISIPDGYLLAGNSWSGISGDKTQDKRGNSDNWIVKIDASGNKIWDKRYGGTGGENCYAIAGKNSAGYLIAGYAGYGISEDKTDINSGYWLLKIDSNGLRKWDKLLPEGEYGTYPMSLIRTSDNGFLLATSSTNDAGGNKSENNLGSQQSWIIKLDSLGNKQWDKTLLTNIIDKSGYALELDNGCYLFGNCTAASVGGYKSEESKGSYDYWVAKFCEGPVGITEITDKIQIQVYPNPTADDISISIQQINLQSATFTIKNTVGQVLYHRQEKGLADSYTKMLDLRDLPSGSYFVTVEAGGESIVKQVVKQ